MKRLLLMNVWLLLSSVGLHAELEKPRTAVVNIQELFRKYYKTEQAQKLINQERARIQKDQNEVMSRLRSLDEGLRQLEVRLQKKDLLPLDKESLEQQHGIKQRERLALEQQGMEAIRTRHQELNTKMVKRMESILREIRQIVGDRAEKTGFDLVFDMDGLTTAQVPVLIFAKEATDITPMILQELNKTAPIRHQPR